MSLGLISTASCRYVSYGRYGCNGYCRYIWVSPKSTQIGTVSRTDQTASGTMKTSTSLIATIRRICRPARLGHRRRPSERLHPRRTEYPIAHANEPAAGTTANAYLVEWGVMAISRTFEIL